MNVKNHRIYTDKLSIRVLDLKHIDLAGEDTNPELILWARIFKAKTMAELEELVRGEEALKDMTLTLHKMSEEEEIRYQCWAREDYEMSMRGAENAGLKKGRAEGKEELLVSLIVSKMKKNKSLDQIAEELERNVEDICDIYNEVLLHAPDYDVEEICKGLAGNR